MITNDECSLIGRATALVALEARDNALMHDFPAFSDDLIPTGLMLIVTEVGEAMKEFRLTTPGQEMPRAFYDELADIILRVGDLAGAQSSGADHLANALVEKIAFNRTRPIRHGGKRV